MDYFIKDLFLWLNVIKGQTPKMSHRFMLLGDKRTMTDEGQKNLVKSKQKMEDDISTLSVQFEFLQTWFKYHINLEQRQIDFMNVVLCNCGTWIMNLVRYGILVHPFLK